ncbi:MAG: hypothetical protein R2824_29225 [Saprospiraceae bacterium]|nr:hypothetical protein [Lewinella sp.]
MRYLSILPLLLITALLWGQDTDQKRMKRDIEVAEKILSELLEERTAGGWQSHACEGAYIEGFGVLFTIRSSWGGMGLLVAPEIAVGGDKGGNVIRGRAGAGSVRVDRDNQKATTVYRFPKDTIQVMDMAGFKEVTETFLADYAYLLTKVPAAEKICIKYSRGGKSPFLWSEAAVGMPEPTSGERGFTAVIRQQIVQDYRMEKIDRKALVNKIEYTENEKIDPDQDRELTLLHSIFKRLYQSDLGDGFYITPNAQIEKIPGMGALFTYQFTTRRHGFFMPLELSGYSIRSDKRGTGIVIAGDDDEDEDDEEETPDFDAFLNDFKSNIIEYGSTVRNLKPEEVLSFQLSIPDCDCDGEQDWPEKIKIVAKQSLLERYRKGNIDLDDAIEQLQVMEL